MADESVPQIISCKVAQAAGLRFYFTGKPCRRGHVAKRYVVSGNCSTCLNDDSRRRSAANPERVAEIKREWYLRNREAMLAEQRISRSTPEHLEKRRLRWKKNRVSIAAARRLYRAENKEKISVQRRNRYAAKKAQIIAVARLWAMKNPERAKEIKTAGTRAYKARKRGAKGSFSINDVRRIRKLQRNRCARCRKSLTKKKVHIDHIIPLSKGGSNDRTNIQLLCGSCNMTKHNRDPIDDARRLGRLL